MRIRIVISAVMMAFLLTACAKQVTAGTDIDQSGEAVDVKLLEKAAPQSSALEIFCFDGTNTIRRIVFDEAWKDWFDTGHEYGLRDKEFLEKGLNQILNFVMIYVRKK